MRLVPKSFILFMHQLQCGHLQSASLVPAHNFSSGAAIVCSIPGTQHAGCRLRPALQPSRYLLLSQNGVLSLPILPFEIERSHKVRDQVSKEAAASRTALQRAVHRLARCHDERSSLSQCLDETSSPPIATTCSCELSWFPSWLWRLCSRLLRL